MQPRGPSGSASDDALRFVRALPVGTKERVVIVEHRGARWMLGVTPAASARSRTGPMRRQRRSHNRCRRRAWMQP
jgi:flagellar biogenesis protein FliO